ncbi:tetratricopeptide repeat protein [Clostridium sp. AL.422]|uniref:tetratricopeptide repeat protein n=1 Tax=Clostridium TaxID=1485 RepID=UPI00293DC1B8|nr:MULTISPECIES: tetratricopeptide repeat protein [unclassified Clostridium]MDV4150653.1 tetratricopeptide repeat protein [Clostridium sp. AL.422]
MDYNAVFKEKLSKLLFLEIDKDGFKNSVGIPNYISFINKDLYLPISSEYITTNIQDEIKIKNLPIFYFIEGMFLAIGADEKLKFIEDYEIILSYIKDSDNCIRSIISNKIKDDKLIDGYLLLKGYYRFSKDTDIMKKLLLVGESIREKDSGFKDILLNDIDYCEKHLLKIPEAYLYKALILKDSDDYKASKVAINEFINMGGKVTEEIKGLIDDINNISNYEIAIEHLKDDPVKTIKMLLELLDNFDNNPLIYYYLGVAYRKLENYEKAIYYLNESIARESGIYEVVVELGINYACINDFEGAIKYFKKAFEVNKEVEVCTNIVMCYMNLGNYDEAKLHLEIAKKLSPEDEIVMDLEKILNK